MPEEEVSQKTEEQLMQEDVIHDLDSTIRDFQEGKIKGMHLHAKALKAWHKARTNEALSHAIEKAFRTRRTLLHQGFGSLDISEHGDPVRARYDPTTWMSSIPEEFRGKEETFLVDRIRSLREFFSGLSI